MEFGRGEGLRDREDVWGDKGFECWGIGVPVRDNYICELEVLRDVFERGFVEGALNYYGEEVFVVLFKQKKDRGIFFKERDQFVSNTSEFCFSEKSFSFMMRWDLREDFFVEGNSGMELMLVVVDVCNTDFGGNGFGGY